MDTRDKPAHDEFGMTFPVNCRPRAYAVAAMLFVLRAPYRCNLTPSITILLVEFWPGAFDT